MALISDIDWAFGESVRDPLFILHFVRHLYKSVGLRIHKLVSCSLTGKEDVMAGYLLLLPTSSRRQHEILGYTVADCRMFFWTTTGEMVSLV